jgi:hypothetical protein
VIVIKESFPRIIKHSSLIVEEITLRTEYNEVEYVAQKLAYYRNNPELVPAEKVGWSREQIVRDHIATYQILRTHSEKNAFGLKLGQKYGVFVYPGATRIQLREQYRIPVVTFLISKPKFVFWANELRAWEFCGEYLSYWEEKVKFGDPDHIMGGLEPGIHYFSWRPQKARFKVDTAQHGFKMEVETDEQLVRLVLAKDLISGHGVR